MEHEVTSGWNPVCNMRLPMIGPYMQHEITNSETLYA